MNAQTCYQLDRPLVPTINLTFSQPMDLDTISVPMNQNYATISQAFLENFAVSSTLDINNVSDHYIPNVSISLRIKRGTTNNLNEFTGYTNLKNKLHEFGIYSIKYYNITYTSQPVHKNNILISLHAKADINGKHYNILSSFLLRISNGTPKIINYILEIIE
jgi:hypothetical protein